MKKQPKQNSISISEISDSFSELPKAQAKKIINRYAKQNKSPEIVKEFKEVNVLDLEKKLEEEGINNCCPFCGSKIVVKNGKTSNGLQRFKCYNCGKRFNRFTGTFLEKTKIDWNTWVEFIHMTINNIALKNIKKNLEDNFELYGVDINTLWAWRHKIMCVAMEIPEPKLRGVIQVDETHIHEAQKGSRNLYNPMSKTEPRKARIEGTPAEYGPMGAEFVTTICAVDEHGHVIGKVSGLGKFSSEEFEKEFDKHFEEISVLCTDANTSYETYSRKKCILHYIQPSDYRDKTAGKTQEQMRRLYEAGEIDRVANRQGGTLPYNEFVKFKQQYGLTLNKVNEFHNEFKMKLVKKPHGVSAKYIEEYTAWVCFLRNYGVDHGHSPTSKKDAEDILKILLKQQTNPLIKEIRAKDIAAMPKPSDKYINSLIKKTDSYRDKKNKYFIFDDETVNEDFSLRDWLLALPLKYLKEMGKDLKIKDWSKAKRYQTYKLRMALEQHPDIKNEIKKISVKYGKSKFDEIK